MGPSAPDLAESLTIDGLTVRLERNGVFEPVRTVSFTHPHDRILAIIGESGSGKSLLLRAIAGVITPKAELDGTITLDGESHAVAARAREVRDRVSVVFQNPMTSLDPVYRVGDQIIEAIQARRKVPRADAWQKAIQLLDSVRIDNPENVMRLYPHECSGGMKQRIVIAIALAANPRVLLADEPTTALDVGVQARLLELLRELHRDLNMGIVLVTHDITVASSIADDIAVMYAGRIVEFGPLREVLSNPRHPYTIALLAANITRSMRRRPATIPGQPPNLIGIPDLCSFAPRCRYATAQCWESDPEGRSVDGGKHSVSCHNFRNLGGGLPDVPLPGPEV